MDCKSDGIDVFQDWYHMNDCIANYGGNLEWAEKYLSPFYFCGNISSVEAADRYSGFSLRGIHRILLWRFCRLL
jgi:hypothetical protein